MAMPLNTSRPLTRNALNSIRAALVGSTFAPAQGVSTGDAAVLIPFCNVRNVPGILFQVRAKSLRSHSGEVSFPGGRSDPTDLSLVDTALRETREELNILPDCVEVLGEVGPPEVNLRGNLTVWPFVGFVYPEPPSQFQGLADEGPLPSCDLARIRAYANAPEVETVFHVPLSELMSLTRLRPSMFRGQRPYWAVGVSDIVQGSDCPPDLHVRTEALEDDSEVGPGKSGDLEIWGLSGWYLTLVMRRLGFPEWS